jgi:hypothetical protein
MSYILNIYFVSNFTNYQKKKKKKKKKKTIVLFTMFLLYYIFIFKDNFLDIATTLNSVTYLYDNK